MRRSIDLDHIFFQDCLSVVLSVAGDSSSSLLSGRRVWLTGGREVFNDARCFLLLLLLHLLPFLSEGIGRGDLVVSTKQSISSVQCTSLDTSLVQ
jgi:hypothetical protein